MQEELGTTFTNRCVSMTYFDDEISLLSSTTGLEDIYSDTDGEPEESIPIKKITDDDWAAWCLANNTTQARENENVDSVWNFPNKKTHRSMDSINREIESLRQLLASKPNKIVEEEPKSDQIESTPDFEEECTEIVVEDVVYKVTKIQDKIIVDIPDPEEDARALLNSDPSELNKFTFDQLYTELCRRMDKNTEELNRLLRLVNIY